MSDFLHMGGYGLYVWSSFGAAALVFLWNVVSIHAGRREAQRRLTDDEGRDD